MQLLVALYQEWCSEENMEVEVRVRLQAIVSEMAQRLSFSQNKRPEVTIIQIVSGMRVQLEVKPRPQLVQQSS